MCKYTHIYIYIHTSKEKWIVRTERLLLCSRSQTLQTVAKLSLARSKPPLHFGTILKQQSTQIEIWVGILTDFKSLRMWNLLTLITASAEPARLLAKHPKLIRHASLLACRRQKPEWSSSGWKHQPGTAALPEVEAPKFKHKYSFDKIKKYQNNEPHELTPPVPDFLSSVLRLNGVLLKEGVLFRGHIPPVGGAAEDWTKRALLEAQLTTSRQGRCRVKHICIVLL